MNNKMPMMLTLALALVPAFSSISEGADALAQLGDPAPHVRAQGRDALIEAGASSLPGLLSAIQGTNPDQDLAAEQAIFRIVQRCAAPDAQDQRKQAAAALLRFAEDGTARLDARRYALRQLAFIANGSEVDALIALMGDDDVWEMAHYALSGVSTDESATAIAAALPSAQGMRAVALLNLLGRGEQASHVDAVIARANDRHRAVRMAAIKALGRIPAPEAKGGLESVMDWQDEEARKTARAAYAALAEKVAAEAERPDVAFRMYERLNRENEAPLWQATGLLGMARMDDKAALPALLAGLDADTLAVRGAAIQSLAALPGDKVTRAIAKRKLASAEGRQAKLYLLGQRGDAAHVRTLLPALDDSDAGVRLAAIEALGRLNNPKAIAPLTAVLGSESEAERNAAQLALGRIAGPKADAALLAAQGRAKSPDTEAALLELMARRQVSGGRERLLVALDAPDQQVRTAAIEGLSRYPHPDVPPALINVIATHSPDEGYAAQQALGALPLELVEAPLRQAAQSNDANTRAAAMQALGARRDPALRDLFIQAAGSDDERVAVAALEALEPLKLTDARDLLRSNALEGTPKRKVAATRSYLALADEIGKQDAEAMKGMYQEVLDRGTEPAQLARALQGAARMQEIAFLPQVERLVDHDSPQVRAEAGRALVPISDKVGVAGDIPKAIELYRTASRTCTEASMLRIASDHLNEAAKYIGQPELRIDPQADAGFLVDWWMLGPLPGRERLRDHDAIATAGAINVKQPVKDKDQTFHWERKTVNDPAGVIDLDSLYGQKGDCGVYAYTTVNSEIDRDIQLKMASDDDIFVWINGELVHKELGDRGIGNNVEDMYASAKLKKGENHILVKVLEGGGAWGFVFRIGDETGRTIVLK